jgi:hypothetical protein
MKIVMGSRPNDVKIYTDSGQDITAELRLCAVTAELRPNEFPRVTLECECWEGELTFDFEQVAAQINHIHTAEEA